MGVEAAEAFYLSAVHPATTLSDITSLTPHQPLPIIRVAGSDHVARSQAMSSTHARRKNA
jgi:hypothetical protein